MAETLTPQQREAVYNRGGRLLVSAAAGSGKTMVLVDRLLSYLTDTADPSNIDEFLIITYTKAAAAELRGKIAAKLSERIAASPGNRHLQQQMQRLYLTKISTVHAFCSDLLREYAYYLDIPADFRVADENECLEIQIQALDCVLENAYQNDSIDKDLQMFINTQGFGRDDRLLPEIILKVYNSSRCHLNPDGWLTWCVTGADTDDLSDGSQTVWGRYLMDDLKQYLALQCSTLKRCAEAAEASTVMEKPAALLRSVISQLEYLAAADTWDEVVARKNIDFGRLVFSKKCTDLELAERIKAIRHVCKKSLEKKLRSFAANSSQVLADLDDSVSAARGLVRLVRNFEKEYDRRKQSRRVLDFGDLEHKTLDLLIGKKRTGPTSLANEIGNRFREILVDEYQDSNAVQDAIFDALTRKRQNCFMVGDVKQSIYQFRLADPGIFLKKYNTYVSSEIAQALQGRKVLLSSNFRSSDGILQCVNDVFSYCMSPEVGGLLYSEDEMLREGLPHVSLHEPEVALYGIEVQEDTYAEEAAFTAKKIRQLLDGTHMIRNGDALRPIRPEDIVILLRSPSSVSGEFVYALEQLGICCTTGSSIDLLRTEEVSVLRSLLQIIDNPLQDIPLIAVMASRVFGFDANELAAIRTGKRWCSMYEAVTAQTDDKCIAFADLVNALRQDARLYNLPQLLQKILMRTSMDSIYAAMEDGIEKKQNINTFCQLAADFESAGRRDLGQFIEYLDALDEKGLSYAGEQQNQSMVTIMSIHKSKGLEFPVVFLCGLSRSFNMESAHAQVLCDKELGIGLNCVDTTNRVRYPTIAKRAISVKIQQDSISEEMRVLYVAMTRARDRLIMTYAAKNLASDISDIALQLDMTEKRLMTGQVNCPGEWILQAAMQRTEAGALFQLGGHPDCVSFKEPVWKIRTVEGKLNQDTVSADAVPAAELPTQYIEELAASLRYTYPYISATQTPSKQTATQLKGRDKDLEAAEDTGERLPVIRPFRKPSFAGPSYDGRIKGNAIHAVMQHIRFEDCTTIQQIEHELMRLKNELMITDEQVELTDPERIKKLFDTPLGKRMQTGKNVLREFKFSILDDSSRYRADLIDEQVLLQGVVDCALIEPEGITVIDFKTDRVSADTIDEVILRYTGQINVYAHALERIFKQKVVAKYLYLFNADRFVLIP